MAQSNPTPDTSVRGRVKKVNSADTIVVQTHDKVTNSFSDHIFHLAELVAPKVAVYTPDQNQTDEPYGWKAREAVRKMLIGQTVFCEVEFRSAKAAFGYVFKGDSNEGESINEIIVSQGFANIKDGHKKNERYEKLKELVEEAKNKRIGIWSDDAKTQNRKISWQLNDPTSFVEKHKKPLRAVVEGIHPNACGVRAFVPVGDTHYYLTVMFAGLRGPSEESKLRPRAMHFLEFGLLHCEVEITLTKGGNNGQLFGVVNRPNCDIVRDLVKCGLAQIQDWSLAATDAAYAKSLREAESVAKVKKLAIWKDFVEKPKPVVTAGSNFTAKVVEIVSADLIVVKEGNVYKKIFLASIRPPRKEAQPTEKATTLAQRMFQQPLLFQAREFLRTRLIGKSVQVQTDYVQPKSEQFPEKVCCTVLLNGQNVAEQLVAEGLATVIRYRQDNDQRSSQYTNLQTAEETALRNQVGCHAKKEPEPMKVSDLQGDPIKSKQYFSSFQRSNPNSGIVEFVSSGSRVRLYCAKQEAVFPFLFNGIQCPRAGRPELRGSAAQEGDPYGDEALQFTKDLCLQHQVEFQVEGQDKNGTMIGQVLLERKNLAVELVKAGLAKVHHYSAEKLRYYQDLKKAEEQAKSKRLRVWQDFVEEEAPEVVAEVVEDVKSERKVELKKVVVSEVTPAASRFYVQFEADAGKLEELQRELQKELSNPAIAPTFKRGDRAVAKFVDGQWYRVRVEKIVQGKAELSYIDYGNKGECLVTELQPLPPKFSSAGDYAHLCNLAFVKMPKDEDELQRSQKAFEQDVSNGDFQLNVEYVMNGEKYVTLKSGEIDIGKALITDGLAYFDPRKGEKYRKICAEYEKAQSSAKAAHRNLWEYGDSREDEGDRF